ncbi:MAG: alpha/beta fold hydrolase [Hyphomicrobiaceae bacterium]
MSIVDRSLKLRGGRTGILLIHGLGGTPIEHRMVAIGLAHQGFTVHCPQLAGHCGTFEDLRDTSWQDWYASVEAAHDELCQSCDTVIVGGLSMGAVMAMHLAAQRPDRVQGLALFAPTLKLDGWGVPWYSAFFSLVTQKWFANLIKFSERDPYGIKDPRIRALVTAAIQSGDSSQVGQLDNPGGVMLEMRWLINTVKREIPNIKQPTLILHPREDDRASLANAFYLQRNLAGPVEVRVLEDSYHVITLDRQRHVVIECTGAFASRIGGKAAGQTQAETYLRQSVPSAAVAETAELAIAEGERARHH